MEIRRPASRIGEADWIDGGRIEGACAFLSDLHLMEPSDAATQTLLSFCHQLGQSSLGGPLGAVKHLFLVGDVFEFIDASASFFRRRWSPVFDAFEQVSARGVQTYFIEGNHDFGFEYVRHREARDPHTPLWGGKWASFVGDAGLEFQHRAVGRMHVRHGDDVIASEAYLRFRSFVKSTFAGKILRQFPARLSHHFFVWLAEQSRKRGEGYILTEDKIASDLRKFLEGGAFQTPDLLVIGHIHVHLDARVGPARVLAGPDWPSAPNYLLLGDDGTLERIFLEGSRPPPLMRFARAWDLNS